LRHEPGGAHLPLNVFRSKEISMNTFVKSILVSSILSIVTTATMVAQPGNSQFDQWYRAKYGRPAPAAQVIAKTSQASPVTETATQPTVAVTEFEHWYRAKYGRPSPSELAAVNSPQVNPASPEAMPPMVMPVAVSDKDVAANTPAEHQRIAQSYRDQAQDYLAQAKQHQAMIVAYKAGPNETSKNEAATINHCEYFIAKFNEMAAKSNELAQLHDQMAKVAATR
jgi:predicted transposase YbfD/YdcC